MSPAKHSAIVAQIQEMYESRLNVMRTELTAEQSKVKVLTDAAQAIEINAEECLDFDECTAMLIPIDDYHALIEALATVKGG